MKKITSSLILLIYIIQGCTLYSQTGESISKMVIINKKEKIISPVSLKFDLLNPFFKDSNMNQKLDGNETGVLGFIIKNTGNTIIRQLHISINKLDSARGISFDKSQATGQINVGDSTFINIPITANKNLKDGNANFYISVSESNSQFTNVVQINIPTREIVLPLSFTWISPYSNFEKTQFPIVKISGLVKTKSSIKNLVVYLDGQILQDQKSFTVIPTGNPDEYQIDRLLSLNEGDNEIKIEAKNNQGTIISENRIINYYIQKIDNSYLEKRLALVIGNADYVNANTLANPLNDAKSIIDALQDVGFTVQSYLNADLKTMKKAMDLFGDQLKDYTVGLFYYAGHGIQVKGNNYLVPIDASLKVEQDVEYDCVDAGRILGKMEAAGTKTNIVILDACRDNPFERSWSGRSIVQGGGLAFMNAPSGSIVAYATSPGKTASDGIGKNGIYTEAILQYIKTPGLSIEDFFKNVRVAVETRSNKTQTPWESTSLKGNFFFKLK